jgi:hypothetical protein
MVMTETLKNFRGYHYFIKRQQRHKKVFGVHPIRAVLVETTDEARGRRLMELAAHPLVCGAAKRAGLFWFSISPLFADRVQNDEDMPSAHPFPHHLDHPEVVLASVWALPDRSLHALGDPENSVGTSASAS